MVSFVFARPSFLWFLIAIPLLILIHFLTLRSVSRRAVKFANFEAISRVTGNQVLSNNFGLLVIRLIIFSLIIFAVAGTTLWYQGEGTEFDFALALDSSNSMLVQDFFPNRLEAAKAAAKNFLDFVSSNNQVALISFTGIPTVEQELTTDHEAIRQKIDLLDIKPVGGTDLGGAIISSVNQLLQTEKQRVIILLTDGQGNIGPETENAIAYAAENGVIINTIGVGTSVGGSLFGNATRSNATAAILRLNEETLVDIAQKTEGNFYKAIDQKTLNEAYVQIASLTITRVSRNLTLHFLVIAIILLMIEWSLINTKYRTLP
ncbi:hypothetical protein CL617_01680 [archaeon]|nr:hypothetical protein [archaeon]|tara:strand:- start:1600 stop:2556 length:957 start_codon:yes stop_codon:yes gene_type:complete